ncbi:MAG: CrcB family protein [Spirochaetales bacterium]|nr:CrcB family protein [Spirochaetales bacterium]
MWYKLSGLLIAGALGTLSRYGLAGLVQRMTPSTYPWGTFTVNAIGCFFFGFIWTLTAERLIVSSETRLIILTGFLGSFTTLSTFIFETEQFIESSQWLLAGANILGGILTGLMAYILGASLARLL